MAPPVDFTRETQRTQGGGAARATASVGLDFVLFVNHVLTDHRVVFLQLKLIRGVPLVFCSRVEVSGSC